MVLRVNSIVPRSGNTISIESGHVLYVPGSIMQVVNTYYTTATSVSIPSGYNTYTDVTGLSASITPKSTSSKIYIRVRWFGEYSVQNINWDCMWQVKRNSSVILQGSQPGSLNIGIHMGMLAYNAGDADSTPESAYFDAYDSPSSTSSLTYQVAVSHSYGSTQTLYINRTVNAATSGGYERGTSSITLWEIAG